MKKILYLPAAFALLFGFSCQSNDEEITPSVTEEQQVTLLKEDIAQDLIELLNQDSYQAEVLTTLQENPTGIKLEFLLDKLEGKNFRNTATNNLRELDKQAEELSANHTSIVMPEIWLHTPSENIEAGQLLVTYSPEGEEGTYDKVKAFTLSGEVVYLDAYKAPEVPVLVVETYGKESMKLEVEYINKKLVEAGLQDASLNQNAEQRMAIANEPLYTTKLNKIRLKDDKEPWTKGGAEIYALVSSIRNSNNDPQIVAIPMEYLDHDDKDYYPNQIMIIWNDHQYQAANVQLFEKDSGHNYQNLASSIASAIGQAGTLAGQPWITALGTLGAEIIKAVPASFWSDDDDYVDSFYTIEKNRSYSEYYGASRNAKVSMAPHIIYPNTVSY
jgi:hypothetical protein